MKNYTTVIIYFFHILLLFLSFYTPINCIHADQHAKSQCVSDCIEIECSTVKDRQSIEFKLLEFLVVRGYALNLCVFYFFLLLLLYCNRGIYQFNFNAIRPINFKSAIFYRANFKRGPPFIMASAL